jgi:hypothetical protein
MHWIPRAVVREAIGCACFPRLNVNVPNVPLGELQGIRQGELARFGAVQTTIA